jgi:hypothetical protein
VALQQTTRQLWASQGPFKPYTVHRVPQQNVPEDYIKTAVWKTDIVPNRYYAQSSAPEESGIQSWYPVEFNPEHICWVEVRWAEPAGSEGYWQAFRIAGEDLRLDITQEEVESHITRTSGINNYRESIASSPTTHVSTPSEPSIIRPRPSPYQPGSRDQEIAQTLAELLNIRDPMSQTLTMPVPVGTINPHTGHVNEDDVALYRAIGPDQADPPSTQGRGSNPPEFRLDGSDHQWEDHQKDSPEAEDPLEVEDSWEAEDSQEEEGHPHQFLFPLQQSFQAGKGISL